MRHVVASFSINGVVVTSIDGRFDDGMDPGRFTVTGDTSWMRADFARRVAASDEYFIIYDQFLRFVGNLATVHSTDQRRVSVAISETGEMGSAER
jgi:hypothetical protein